MNTRFPRQTRKKRSAGQSGWCHQLIGAYTPVFPHPSKDLSKALDELMSTKGGLTGSAGGASSSRPKKHVAYICGGKLQPFS